jgi:hypothetical protein
LAVLAATLLSSPAGIATLKLGSKLPLLVFEQPKRLRVFEQPKRPLEQVERVLVAGDEMPLRLTLSDQRPLLGDYSTCPRYMSDSIGHGLQDTSFLTADHLFNGSAVGDFGGNAWAAMRLRDSLKTIRPGRRGNDEAARLHRWPDVRGRNGTSAGTVAAK